MADEGTVESVFNVNLRKARDVPTTRRARTAVRMLKEYISRHMKAQTEDVWIDTHVSEYIWSRGAAKPPTKITVRATKFEDGLVEVTFPEE
ncbi:MAG: 50S ribosomal protein L31e [Methanomassiliicoccales archaeon]